MAKNANYETPKYVIFSLTSKYLPEHLVSKPPQPTILLVGAKSCFTLTKVHGYERLNFGITSKRKQKGLFSLCKFLSRMKNKRTLHIFIHLKYFFPHAAERLQERHFPVSACLLSVTGSVYHDLFCFIDSLISCVATQLPNTRKSHPVPLYPCTLYLAYTYSYVTRQLTAQCLACLTQCYSRIPILALNKPAPAPSCENGANVNIAL